MELRPVTCWRWTPLQTICRLWLNSIPRLWVSSQLRSKAQNFCHPPLWPALTSTDSQLYSTTIERSIDLDDIRILGHRWNLLFVSEGWSTRNLMKLVPLHLLQPLVFASRTQAFYKFYCLHHFRLFIPGSHTKKRVLEMSLPPPINFNKVEYYDFYFHLIITMLVFVFCCWWLWWLLR